MLITTVHRLKLKDGRYYVPAGGYTERWIYKAQSLIAPRSSRPAGNDSYSFPATAERLRVSSCIAGKELGAINVRSSGCVPVEREFARR